MTSTGERKKLSSVTASTSNFESLRELVGLSKDDIATAARRYRTAADRPRPDLPPNAHANRSRPQIAVTLPPELVQRLNEVAQSAGLNRSQLIEAAIRMMIDPHR